MSKTAKWLLAALAIFFSLVFIAQIYRDFYFPPGDMARHLVRSLYFYRQLQAGFSLETLSKLYFFRFPQFFHPPLVYFAAQPLYWLLGANPQAAKLTMIPFLWLLMGGAFLLGKEIKGEKTGLLAAFLSVSCPAVLFYFDYFYLDIPLAALVVFDYYLLLKSRAFQDLRFSLACGLVGGLGMLVKWNFAFYLLPAYGLALFNLLKSRRWGDFKNFAAAMAGLMILALPWYWARLGSGLEAYRTFLLPSLGQDLSGDKLEHWRLVLGGKAFILHFPYYFLYLLKFHFLPPVFILSLLGTFFAFRASRTRDLALSVWLSFIVISLLPPYQDRYLLPLLPGLAVLASFFWAEAKSPRIWLLALPLLFFGLVQTVGWVKPLPYILNRLPRCEVVSRIDFERLPLYEMGKKAFEPWIYTVYRPFEPEGGYTEIPALLKKLGTASPVLMMLDFDHQWMIRTYAALEWREYLYYTPLGDSFLRFSDFQPQLEGIYRSKKPVFRAVICKEGCYFQKGKKNSPQPRNFFPLSINPRLTYQGTFRLAPGKSLVLLKSAP